MNPLAISAAFCVCSSLLEPLHDSRDLKTISLTIRLRTGGEVSGAVLDHNSHGFVVLSKNTPFVFSWSELDPASALTARRRFLEKERGGPDQLMAMDHFRLGVFVLDQGRNDLAANEFEQARKKNPRLKSLIDEEFARFRRERGQDNPPAFPKDDAERDDAGGPIEGPPQGPGFEALPPPGQQVRSDIREAYLKFGEKVRELLGKDIRLIESDHFLIWTDWGPKEEARLTQWCESMYAALCERFGLDSNDDIFLAKCPVFCFRSKARLKKFARDFDGYDAKNAIGYTRSIEQNGHVHMAFARMGAARADYDRFACTLVHEGTHAFLHRVYGFRLLPNWVNEGYAELTSERVLPGVCPAGENASLLAKQYVRFDWQLAAFLAREASIEVHEYPLAHSIVAYLDSQGLTRFAAFIRELKHGSSLPEALQQHYGLTFEQLENAWKQSHLKDADFAKKPD